MEIISFNTDENSGIDDKPLYLIIPGRTAIFIILKIFRSNSAKILRKLILGIDMLGSNN